MIWCDFCGAKKERPEDRWTLPKNRKKGRCSRCAELTREYKKYQKSQIEIENILTNNGFTKRV